MNNIGLVTPFYTFPFNKKAFRFSTPLFVEIWKALFLIPYFIYFRISYFQYRLLRHFRSLQRHRQEIVVLH